MNTALVNCINAKIIINKNTKDLTGDSGIVKRKKLYRGKISVKHIHVNENVARQEIKSEIRTDTITSVDIQEIERNGGTVLEFYEGLLQKQTVKYPLYRGFSEKNFSHEKTRNKGE